MKTVGRYELRGELGAGGMATVYRAYDPSFRREVAVKVLPKSLLDDPQSHRRFRREARTIANLEHAAIVPVYDFGEADGVPYLVMRFMTGGSLSDRINGPLPIAEVLRIMRILAPALDYAHTQGVVHRDLKPGNILFDAFDSPFLADFGIVKVASSNTALTQAGGLIGTPAYMSPEQIHGAALDGRSDLYALGVILYQMLSGKLPYESATPWGQAAMHLNSPVPDILAVKRDLPAGAGSLIMRAMAKAPEERYATAAELVAALANVAGGTIIDAPPAEESSRREAERPGSPTGLQVPTTQSPGPREHEPRPTPSPAPESLPVSPPPLWRRPRVVGSSLALLIFFVLAGVALADMRRNQMEANSSVLATGSAEADSVRSTSAAAAGATAVAGSVNETSNAMSAAAATVAVATGRADSRAAATSAEATSQAISGATATGHAERNATAHARGTATTVAVATGTSVAATSQAGATATFEASRVLLAGPFNGNLLFDENPAPENFYADVDLRDFIAYAEFSVPFAPQSGEHWEIGFAFRDDGENAYRLYVSSGGLWDLTYYLNGQMWNSIASGNVTNMNATEGATNTLWLRADGADGAFVVNDSGEPTALDLSYHLGSGDIAVDTGYLGVPGETTRFDHFTVYEVTQDN